MWKKLEKSKWQLITRSTAEPELSSGENPDLQSASNLIQLSKTKEGGQFIIAKDNVKTGDVLLVEKPVVSNLLTKFYGTHCMHCLSR